MAPTGHRGAKYSEGEKILCYHGPLIYEAKCLKIRTSTENHSTEYFVHYAGWNKNWDEWVSETRILKYNDTNIQKQRELQNKYKKKTTKKGKSVTGKSVNKGKKGSPSRDIVDHKTDSVCGSATKSRSSTPSQVSKAKKEPRKKRGKRVASTTSDGRRKRKKKNTNLGPEIPLIPKVKFSVDLPPSLNDWLIDDQDFVARQKLLLILPAVHTVSTIMNQYFEYKEKFCSHFYYKDSLKNIPKATDSKGMTYDPELDFQCRQILKTLCRYFNIMLGSQLLVKRERPQYAEMLVTYPNTPMSEIYGAHHLLRLLVSLDWCVLDTLNQLHCDIVSVAVNDLIKYLDDNNNMYFNITNYGIAPPEYHRRSM